MEGVWMCVTGKTFKSDLVNGESFVLSGWEEEIRMKFLLTLHIVNLRWLEKALVFNFWRVKWRWRNHSHGDVGTSCLSCKPDSDAAASALSGLLKTKMLYCILRILLILNISQSCSNLLQPTVTNCSFLRKSELVQFTSNRKCIQGWDGADFPCTQKASLANRGVLKDAY